MPVKPPDGKRLPDRECDISVVIPAYHGAATIAECLRSVREATRNHRHEIIVVESSGDGLAEIVRDRFPEVVLVCSAERLTAGAARNRGAAEARGRLVFFTDQDCVVPPDWISALEQHMNDRAVGAAGGAVGIRDPSNLSGCAVYFLEFLNHFPELGPAQRNENFLVGCNTVCRPEALKEVRFPDQTLGEDVLMSHLMRDKGFDVVYDPRIEVLHHNRKGWREFFEYNRKMGRAAAISHDLLQLWWIEPFFRVPALAFLAPFLILPTIAIDLLHSRWSYLFRFLLLSPMCLLGNLAWASAFRTQALRIRSGVREPIDRPFD
jgi:GT2 family glycosyltransferase